jgi:lysozyme
VSGACGDEAERVARHTSALSVQEAVDGGCSTAQVEGLSLQIIAQANCIEPGAYAELEAASNLSLGPAALPYMQEAGRDALAAALSEHAATSMTINSMLRTVAQQYLLYRWYKQAACGIALAAKPGSSNHETGLAVDISPHAAWRSALEGNGFAWFGVKDAVHFDYVAGGTQDLGGVDVLAFQQLWNDNHPDDVIAEDGLYGPQTEARLQASPADGFEAEVECDPSGGDDPPAAGGFSLAWSVEGLEDVYTDGPSSGVHDAFVGDQLEVVLRVTNDSGEKAQDVVVGLLSDGRLLIDVDGAEPGDIIATQAQLGDFDVAETKDVPLMLIAHGYSVDGPKPASIEARIGEVSERVSLDVYDVKRAEFDGQRFEGWHAIGDAASQALVDGALVLNGHGPRLIARSANRPFTPQRSIELRASRSGHGASSRAQLLLVPADPEAVAMAIPLDLPADGQMHEISIDVPEPARQPFDAIEVIFFDEASAPAYPLNAELDYIRIDKTVAGPGDVADAGCSIAGVVTTPSRPSGPPGAAWACLLGAAALAMRRKWRHKRLPKTACFALGLSLGSMGCTADTGEAVGSIEWPLPKSVCAEGTTVPGIDVSYYQGDIDWQAVAADGVKFAITRVNHGGFMDPKFDQNWAAIREMGMLRGAYQYFNPSGDPVAQAQTFIDKVGPLQPGDLPAVIDVESTDGLSPSAIASNVATWLELVEEATGRQPMIYTAGYFWNDNVETDAFNDHPLWTAHYTNACPYVPDPWAQWTIWQYTSSGAVAGISGNVDRNRFNGAIENIHDLAANGYRAEIESLEYRDEIEAGQTASVRLVLKNVGARSWGANTRLGTTQPRDRASLFATGGWIDDNRVVAFDTSVAPGESVELTFGITAPDEPGEHSESFNLVEEGVAWFSDINPGGGPTDDAITLRFSVTSSTGSDAGDEAWDGDVFDLSLQTEASASCAVSQPASRRPQATGWLAWLLLGLPFIMRRRDKTRLSG